MRECADRKESAATVRSVKRFFAEVVWKERRIFMRHYGLFSSVIFFSMMESNPFNQQEMQ